MAKHLKDVLSALRIAQADPTKVTSIETTAKAMGGAAFQAALMRLHQTRRESAGLKQHPLSPNRVESNLARLMASAYACDSLLSSIAAQRTQLANLKIALRIEETEALLATDLDEDPMEKYPDYTGAYVRELKERIGAHQDANTKLGNAATDCTESASLAERAIRQCFGGKQESKYGQYARNLAEYDNDNPANDLRREAAEAITVREMKLGEFAMTLQKYAGNAAAAGVDADRNVNSRMVDALGQSMLTVKARRLQHKFALETLTELKTQLELEEELAAAVTRLSDEAQLAKSLAIVFADGLKLAYGHAVPGLVNRWTAHLTSTSVGYEDPADVESLLGLLSTTDSALRDMLAHAKSGCEVIEVTLDRDPSGAFSAVVPGAAFGLREGSRLRGFAAASLSNASLKLRLSAAWPQEQPVLLTDTVVSELKSNVLVPQGAIAVWNREVPENVLVSASPLGLLGGQPPDKIAVLLCVFYLELPGKPD